MSKSIEDIAAHLKVSVTTVRLVLLGKARQYRISEKTEARVREYTEQHGAKINHTARALRLNRTDSLGLIVPRLSNYFFAALAEKMEICCREAGLQLSISCCYDDPTTQLQLIEHFRQRNIDGLFLVPANATIPTKAQTSFQDRLVLLDRDFGFHQVPTIVTENYATAYALAEKLYAYLQQHAASTSTLFIGGNVTMPSISARIDGFNDARGKHPHNFDMIRVAKNQFGEGLVAMEQFLATGAPLPSALVTSSIALLQGALQALKNTATGIPPTLVLATFDDHTMLDLLNNPVLSVRQDYDAIITAAFDEMTKLINHDENPLHHTAKMTIIERNLRV